MSFARILSFLAVLVLACGRPAGPAETYRQFAAAVRQGRADVAWTLLSKESRAALDAAARETARRAPGVVPPSGAGLVIGDSAFGSRPLKSALVARESEDRAVVVAEVEGEGKREVALVREDGAWRVVIPPEALAGEGGGQAP
ncbi:MAG TPA: hypothetical protein VD838_22640 [Anaeromyxobacteraceae bacterium]|nr:hypothetical protein [Anaeromyxobacteraceae bacterium]